MTFCAVIITTSPNIKVVHHTGPSFVSANRTRTRASTIFGLGELTSIIIFRLHVKGRHGASTYLSVQLSILANRFMGRCQQRQRTKDTQNLITVPVNMDTTPMANSTASITLRPTLVPVGLRTRPMDRN